MLPPVRPPSLWSIRRLIVCLSGFLALSVAHARAADNPDGIAFFETKVRPVLVEHCYKCHSDKLAKPKGALRLDTREGVLKGGTNGAAVLPGKPDESPIIEAITAQDDNARMPPKGRLTDSVVADLKHWIAIGAPDPRDGSKAPSAGDRLDWWSLKPIVRHQPPNNVDRASRTSIDAFILARLGEKGLQPAPEADRRTLIRRLTFDLIGLPPTPDEIDAFLADISPDAYERLVDRLLASPHYGERWARHWMDLVHFAETHGHDQDRIRPNAWRYRDYLIESFNRDTPYSRFVQEQVAADVLFPDEPRLIPALGFLAAGPWDESSLRDIREDSIDRRIGHYLDRDDVVTTTMATFVSSTVHCARCHDHKFDPISQSDYYGMQAVFAGIGRADRAYDPDPAVGRLRGELSAKRKALHARDPSLLASLLDPAIQSEVAAWESRQRVGATWTILDPDRLQSAGGATLTEEPDHSVLSGGTRPAQETVTISATPELRGITAFRLEVLPDDRLPMRGPGRNDNGNLHLTEFRIFAPATNRPDDRRPVPIRAASSDFDQAGWGVASAIDRNEQTAWGVYPEVGKPHQAVFELTEDLAVDGPVVLTFELQQTAPAGHPIGKLRLAATTASRPVHVSALPDAIAAVIATPQDRRTVEQRRELAAYWMAGSLDRRIGDLPAPLLVYAGAADFIPDGTHKPVTEPRAVHVLNRGNILQPGALAVPGALGAVRELSSPFNLPDTNSEGPRRAALAHWLSDPRNPLTWRSIVNRMWQHHFGRGLVDTPNDFGRMGSQPTHPELLDRLAADFRDDGGSLKRLHRRIVTSATYRRSTRHDDRAAAIDGDNRLLWRQNRRRLDAEAVRDAMLAASGRIDLRMGGPSVRQFDLSPGVHVTPVVDYSKYDWGTPESGRRSVYRFLFRTLPDPFVDALDGADASQLTPVRTESATALQALALLNDRFVLSQADAMSRRLELEAPDLASRIRRAFRLTLGRDPVADEMADWLDYARKHGLANACRVLFNDSEFLFVD